jgi:DnaK suppressor protein
VLAGLLRRLVYRTGLIASTTIVIAGPVPARGGAALPAGNFDVFSAGARSDLPVNRISQKNHGDETDSQSRSATCIGRQMPIEGLASRRYIGATEVAPGIEGMGSRMTATKVQAYRPSDKEPFMNDRQREYFRDKLIDWKEDILRESRETLQNLQDENNVLPDLADRASTETDRALELRTRDRQRKLIAKIDAALKRIDEGTYGYCEETGDPISLRRLDARPIATLSIEAQERHERRERVYRDD